jgi:hypothetical protein
MDKKHEDALPCADKLTFDTKAQATATATAVAYQRGSKLKPYICQHCKLWHLASDYKT